MQESGENYLESILILKRRKGVVRAVDVAEFFGYSKASVSRAMRILKENGFIGIGKSRELLLTPEGEKMAEEIFLRHNVIARYLRYTLGISAEEAEENACRIEHIISGNVFEKMECFVREHETANK